MHLSDTHLKKIVDYQPMTRTEFSLMKAAVGIILRDTKEGTEVLLMQRAEHKNDPWSGQMAFPGGKIDASDRSAKDAAIREVEEEVGIQLSEEDYLGQMDDIYGLKVDNQFSVHVSCFIFKPKTEPTAIGNHEVADLVWLPLSWLHNADHAHEYTHPMGRDVRMPSVLINEAKGQVLWGLSLRIMAMLHDLMGLEVAALSKSDQQHLREIEKQNLSSKEMNERAQRHFSSSKQDQGEG